MAATYEPIATQTLGSATATVTFSSISGSHTDLILVTSVRGTANNNANLRFNNDSGSNYSNTYLEGDGSTAYSGRRTNQTSIVDGGFIRTTADTFSVNIIQIMNYANTTTNKTAIMRSNQAGSAVQAVVGLWRSTSAIDRIDVIAGSGNFEVNSTFTLYGIKAA